MKRTGEVFMRAMLILALLCGPVPVAQAQTAVAKGKPAKPQAHARPSEGPQEGIKVHGEWNLTVRNPDGTVSRRYHFKNALSVTFSADRFLAQLLAGDVTPGHWTVWVLGSPANICNPNGNSACIIVESGAPINGNSTNLTVAVPTSGPDSKKLVLTGSVKVALGGNIQGVQTILLTCPNTTAPASCSDSNFNVFTEKLFPAAAPIPVVANQTVDVTVVISFS